MAQVIADRRDIDFVLFEQLEAERLAENELYGDFNRKTIEMIVTEARNLAVKEMLPIQPGDVAATYANIDDLVDHADYRPGTPVHVGIRQFVDWYVDYYQ